MVELVVHPPYMAQVSIENRLYRSVWNAPDYPLRQRELYVHG